MRKRWHSQFVLLTGLVCIVTACTQASSPHMVPTPTPHAVVPTIMATQSPSPTATPLGGPFAQLGPLPKNCPAGPAPQIISSDFGAAVGANTVWVGAGNFRIHPPSALIWSPADARFEHDQYGWGHKFLYVVATSYQGQVTIHGANLSDGSPVYLDAQDAVTAGPATTLLLDTRSPTIANRGLQWTQFPGGITIPKAGCYSLEATWSGGSWRITFVAGVVAP